MKNNTSKVYFLLAACLIQFCAGAVCDAARVAYSVENESDMIAVRVDNLSFADLHTLQVELDYGPRDTSVQSVESLAAGSSYDFKFNRLSGKSQNDQPIIVRILYENGGEVLYMVDVVDSVSLDRRDLENSPIRASSEFVVGEGKQLRVQHAEGIRLVPVYTEEAEVLVSYESTHETAFELTGSFSSVRLPTVVHFLCYDGEEYLGHVSTRAVSRASGGYLSWLKAPVFGGTLFWAFAVAFLCFYIVESNRSGERRRLLVSVARWSFTLGLFSVFFLGLECLWILPDRLLVYVYPLIGSEYLLVRGFGVAGVRLLEWLYFTDPNVILFRRYFAEPMFVYLLTANFSVIHFLQRSKPATDKNWHLLRTAYSMLPFVQRYDGRVVWTSLSKTGLLAFCVKVFFIPLLVTWTITNLYILLDGAVNFSGNFYEITSLVIATFIFIDVVVFTAGYLIELPQLGNTIRTVEPSLLGWIVCLMCYPPFNKFSFEYFGTLEWSSLPALGGWVAAIATVIVVLLWAIYVWATIALGWRASNLTNRGIVYCGPYKYIRHPAYAAKIAAWALGACFLGEKALMVVMALCAVYVLRAWTEERHLSADPEYLAYKEKVRWKFIPRVI